MTHVSIYQDDYGMKDSARTKLVTVTSKVSSFTNMIFLSFKCSLLMIYTPDWIQLAQNKKAGILVNGFIRQYLTIPKYLNYWLKMYNLNNTTFLLELLFMKKGQTCFPVELKLCKLCFLLNILTATVNNYYCHLFDSKTSNFSA